jgi:hypothetical protein
MVIVVVVLELVVVLKVVPLMVVVLVNSYSSCGFCCIHIGGCVGGGPGAGGSG